MAASGSRMIIGNHYAPDFIVDYFRKITNLRANVTGYFDGIFCINIAMYFQKMKTHLQCRRENPALHI